MAWRFVCISIFMLMLAMPSMAQNTKGDKPTSTRETRFKKTSKKQKPAKRVRSKRGTTTSLRAYTPRKKSRGGERAGQALGRVANSRPGREGRQNTFSQHGPFVNNKSVSAKNAQRRSSTPKQRRVTGRQPSNTTRNVYPQSGRFTNFSSTSNRRPPRKKATVTPRSASRSFIARRSINVWANFSRPKQKKEKAYTGDIAGRRIRTKNFETKRPEIVSVPRAQAKRLAPGRRKPRYTPQVAANGNPSPYPKRTERATSNRSTLARLKKLQTPQRRQGGQKLQVVPRSASSSFLARRSTNVWAHFPRPKRRSERATTKDIAGRPLRTRNYHSPKQEIIPSLPRAARRFSDYAKRGGGNYKSASRNGRAWQGDVARRNVRGRNSNSSRGFIGKMKWGFLSATKHGETRPGQKLPPKGFNNQGEGFAGNMKFRRSGKGGGSISGRAWNNQGSALPARTPGVGANGIDKYKGNVRRRGFGDQGEGFSGNIKSRRPVKGGGSISGRVWNNQGSALPARTPGVGADGIDKYRGNVRRRGFQDQGEEFSGNIKARRPAKGGGSVSGRVWNNQQSAIPVRTPSKKAMQVNGYPGKIKLFQLRPTFSDQGEEYSGNMKAKRPVKGGGSISGKLWNNNRVPIAARVPKRTQGEEFAGNIKAKRPAKGGGSISFRLWNNNEKPIDPRVPKRSQGEEFAGNIKAKRPAKGGGSISGKLWNNDEKPIEPRIPERSQGEEFAGNIKVKDRRKKQGEEFAGNIKLRHGYVRNPNSAEEALKKHRDKTTFLTDGLHIKVKQRAHGRSPHSVEDAVATIKPGKSSISASQFAKGVKQYRYVRNGSSSDDAMKVREPGKAFARATDFQGNIKMKKFDIFGKHGLHPDAQFVKTNKNNVDGEKDVMTNFKLWWARLFKKNDTQPDHLKDKGHKPRYDKGEMGLWYDQHNKK